MRRAEQSALHAERTARVVTWLCVQMQAATLHPGDRIPSEVELARAASVSSRHAHAAIACLCTLGILRRTESAVVLAEDPPPLLLELVAARCATRLNDAREALHILMTNLAGLAAQRASQDDDTAMAEELAAMYAAGNSAEHLEHAVRFHRIIARAAGNSVLAPFTEALMISESGDSRVNYEAGLNLHESARTHGEIYRAIRRRQPADARTPRRAQSARAVIREGSSRDVSQNRYVIRCFVTAFVPGNTPERILF